MAMLYWRQPGEKAKRNRFVRKSEMLPLIRRSAIYYSGILERDRRIKRLWILIGGLAGALVGVFVGN